jgi:hypothetical protein
VRHLGAYAANDNGHDVEPHLYRPRPTLTKPVSRESPQPSLFERADGLGRLAPPVGGARFDLTEDKCPAPPRNEVDLAVRTAVVTLRYYEAEAPVQLRGEILTSRSDGRSCIHGTRLKRRYDKKEVLVLHAWRFW